MFPQWWRKQELKKKSQGPQEPLMMVRHRADIVWMFLVGWFWYIKNKTPNHGDKAAKWWQKNIVATKITPVQNLKVYISTEKATCLMEALHPWNPEISRSNRL